MGSGWNHHHAAPWPPGASGPRRGHVDDTLRPIAGRKRGVGLRSLRGAAEAEAPTASTATSAPIVITNRFMLSS